MSDIKFPGPSPKWYIPFGDSWRIDHFYKDDRQLRRAFRRPLCWLPARWLWKYSCWLGGLSCVITNAG